jgi:DNA-directed RNA polymerase specialized sigma24 family protein
MPTLDDDEAQDVVQETLISVARHMPTFRYDPAIGSFKTWVTHIPPAGPQPPKAGK